ncbi:MAG: C4-dicarboxylate ABC transporter substrate-binding protein, partial [Mangrovicoccus sp.]
RSYESLPEADRAVLDDMSGRATAEWIASVVDETDAQVEADFRAAGEVTFTDIDGDDSAAWAAAFAGAEAAWVAGQADTAAAEAALETAKAVAAK